MSTLRIVTYNFLSGGSAQRNRHWSMVRRRLRPDVILTQESNALLARAGSVRTNLHALVKNRRWGSALVARTHPVRSITLRGYRGWIQGGELEEISLTGRAIRVFSIHCPAGAHGYVRTMHEILDRLRPHAKHTDLLLGGDFNVAAGFRDPGDAVRMSPAERALLVRMTEEFGLMPCWQTANPGLPLAQTLRWMRNRSAPYHCDGIFAPASWRPLLKECRVVNGPEWDALSDHNPVLAVFSS